MNIVDEVVTFRDPRTVELEQTIGVDTRTRSNQEHGLVSLFSLIRRCRI